MLLLALQAPGQELLQRKVTVRATQRPVQEVLQSAEKQAGFFFSYNSNILRGDSIVSISLGNRSVKELLERLFGEKYHYSESGKHLIIQPAISYQYWYVSGRVIDKVTGEPVGYATVYERQQLISTMTDEEGRFRLQLKERRPNAAISISKVSYADTLIQLATAQQQELTISMAQVSYTLDSVVISGVEKTWLAGLFLSSKQTMNSFNLNSFFSKQPFQFSLTPGLGSHGRMGAQVINKFSMNILGGYTAGVNGFELGGLFNIVKKDMQYAQVAGLFNIVGDNAYGVQIAGMHNSVLDSASGVQVAGISNIVNRDLKGIQVAGIYNHALHSKGVQASGIGNIDVRASSGVNVGGIFNSTRYMEGVQVAGIANVNAKKTSGIQIAGIANVSVQEMKGLQVAGILNLTKVIKGVQIGFINIADTSEGYSIGLLNIIRKGYHKLSVSTNEVQHLSIAYKSGNERLYSILAAGTQLDPGQKAYTFGYGLGSDLPIGHKGWFINPELVHLYIFAGDAAQQNLLNRLHLHVKYRLGKFADLYAGPAFSVLYAKQVTTPEGYRADFINGYPSFSIGKEVKAWIGWSIGLDLF